jgi:glycosyltransferase involved in cell wall biosynthesis
MKICLDARWIFPELSGIGLYTQELIKALAHTDRLNEYTLLFQDPAVLERTRAVTRFDQSPRVHTHLVDYGVFSLKNQIRLPRFLADGKFDLYHSTNYMMPLLCFGTVKRAVTIHDLIPLLFPDHAPRSRKTRLFPLYKGLMLQVGAKADMIITVSASTRRDVLRELRIPDARAASVITVPEGVTPEYKPGPRPPSRAERSSSTSAAAIPTRTCPAWWRPWRRCGPTA